MKIKKVHQLNENESTPDKDAHAKLAIEMCERIIKYCERQIKYDKWASAEIMCHNLLDMLEGDDVDKFKEKLKLADIEMKKYDELHSDEKSY